MNTLVKGAIMQACYSFNDVISALSRRPDAYALVSGDGSHPGASGRVNFYSTRHGVIVAARFTGLPADSEMCSSRVFAFHIHSGTECSGNAQDPFANALTHYNPENTSHPHHAGDLPPLFSNCGMAVSVFLTNRFLVEEIIGRTVIVHDGVDDFTSQPSGNAGQKIMCGVIKSGSSGAFRVC